MKSYDGTDVGKYIVKKLFNAEKYAYICSPYIDEYYGDAILRLAERGVNVKVIASNRQAGFHLVDFFEEYDGKDEDFDYIILQGEGYVHAKMYIMDDSYAVDGSANLTKAGLWSNVEHVNIYESNNEVQAVKKSFETIWKNNEGEEGEEDDEDESW